MEKELYYIGNDSNDRPVYKDKNGRLYVDTEPRKNKAPRICTKYKNDFDGEPDTPKNYDFVFIPSRKTW